tara:strand:+ start:3283 stop:3753 length:471 start_codon:yes stop_codon:yes gene_type:complete
MGIGKRPCLEILYHPDADTINDKLLKFIDWLPDATPEESSLVVEKHTGFDTFPKIFRELSDWVLNTTTFEINPTGTELWAAIYNEGDYADPHTHTPCSYSFVYYVRVPDGSSPLVFEDRTIETVTGMCVIFSSDYKHAVPPNTSKGRVVLAGNYYT